MVFRRFVKHSVARHQLLFAEVLVARACSILLETNKELDAMFRGVFTYLKGTCSAGNCLLAATGGGLFRFFKQHRANPGTICEFLG